LRDGDDQRAVAALARNHGLPVLSALKDSLQRVEMEVASRSLAAVAAKAGGFEERPNVLFKCNVFRVGGGRKLRLVCGRNLGGPIDSLTTRAWTTPVRPTKTAWAAGATARTAGSIRAAAWCSAGNSLAGVSRLILGGVVVAAEN
jgi:hypothetical protein